MAESDPIMPLPYKDVDQQFEKIAADVIQRAIEEDQKSREEWGTIVIKSRLHEEDEPGAVEIAMPLDEYNRAVAELGPPPAPRPYPFQQRWDELKGKSTSPFYEAMAEYLATPEGARWWLDLFSSREDRVARITHDIAVGELR
jgi:hypothetical protein